MKDAIGNKITEGSLVYWKSKDLALIAVKVDEGGLSVVGSDGPRRTPPLLVLQLTLPVNVERGVTDPLLGDFLVLVNPNATKAIEGMMKQ